MFMKNGIKGKVYFGAEKFANPCTAGVCRQFMQGACYEKTKYMDSNISFLHQNLSFNSIFPELSEMCPYVPASGHSLQPHPTHTHNPFSCVCGHSVHHRENKANWCLCFTPNLHFVILYLNSF